MLDALRRDGDAGGTGLTAGDVARAAGTRWPLRTIRAICQAGYVIGEMNDRYVLVREPRSTEAPDGRRPTSLSGQSSGVSVDPGPQRLFDVPVRYRAEAA